MAAVTAAAAPGDVPLTPRVILQVDHAQPVDAGGFSADGRIVVTASGPENSVMVRDAATGIVIDRIAVPPLDPALEQAFRRFEGLRVAPDLRSVTIDAVNVGGESIKGLYVPLHRKQILTVDLHTRVVSAGPLGPPVRPKVPDAQRADLKRAVLARAADGTRLERNARTIVQLRAPGGTVRALGRPKTRDFGKAALAPDGTRLALATSDLVSGIAGKPNARWTTTIEVLPLGSADAPRPLTVPGYFDSMLWLDNRRALLFESTDAVMRGADDAESRTAPAAMALVDLADGKPVATLPARCSVTAVGGRLVGAGLIDCHAGVPDDRGLWIYDPAAKMPAWQRLPVPALKGRLIDRIAAFPDGKRIVVGSQSGTNSVSLHVVDLATGRARQDIEFDADGTVFSAVSGLTVATDGAKIVALMGNEMFAWDPDGDETFLEESLIFPDFIASDGANAIVGIDTDKALIRIDLRTGKTVQRIAGGRGVAGAFLPGKPVFVALLDTGVTRFWDTRSWAELLSVYSLPGQKFFAVDPSGRYDTNLGADATGLRWRMDDAPLQSLGPQTFMRNLYEPGLLRRVLDCAPQGCAKEFPPLPSLRDLNRILPVTEIVGIVPAGPNRVSVTVEVRETARTRAENGKRLSGVYDLRLFRDGRLVRQTPDLGIARDEGKTLPAWRAATAVPLAMEHERYRETFEVAVPLSGGKVEFSAYAFNEDRVKGETARRTLVLPPPATPPRRRLVVVAIGIDRTRNPQWHLNYAANDARGITAALAAVPDADETVIPLISDANDNRATKRIIRSVLLALGGNEDEYNRNELVEAGIDLAKLTPVGPDDAVVIAFSGHGTTLDRQFYLLPWDADEDQATGAPQPQSMISSVELTAWLRQLDAGEIAFVIDACHSAASVDGGGFKPGPMGDPGLGQLAFDKGIRILAATQANDVALEDGKLGHGLLSYALNEGLGGPADADRDGAVTLGEWLDYGVRRMPGLAAELRDGTVKLTRTVATPRPASAVVWFDAPDASVTRVQQPALFDFTGTPGALVLRRVTNPAKSLRSR